MKSLTNVIIKNSKRRDNQVNEKSNILEGLAFFIVFAFLSLAMIFFSYTVTKQLKQINQTYAFINILLLMNFMILFVKSVFESLNVLYFSKDLKILLRMPLKSRDIVHGKIFNMIISEYQMEIIMLAIPMIVYGIFTHANLVFYLYMILILLVLPIIPIVITSVVISIIMRFTNFIKDKSKVMYITIILTILIISLLTMNFNAPSNFSVTIFQDLILQANGLAENIADRFILIKPIMNALLNYNNIEGLKNLIIYFVENIICYILGIFIISKLYLKGAIGTTVNSKKISNIDDKELYLEDFKSKSLKKSYINKEKITLKRTPIFCIQCLIMPILYPISVLFIILAYLEFSRLVGYDLLGIFYKVSITSFGTAIFLAVGQVFYMMNFNSIIAVSRESKYAKLIKYLPIELKKQFNFKLNMGIKVNLVTTIIVSICNYIFAKNLFCTVMIFISLLLLNIIVEKFKLLIDLKNPKINWTSEYTMMKQNTNVMYVLFYTLIVSGIIFSISLFIKINNLYALFILISLCIVNIIINEYIRKNQSELFDKIY